MGESIVKILMRRDGMGEDEAREAVREFVEEVHTMIADGCKLYELEDFIASEFGLEPDYLEEILFY